MAGSGAAVRLHEFKEPAGTGQLGSRTVLREGRDVLGLYPGQLARVHTIQSPLYRSRLMLVENRRPASHDLEESYQRSFDLLTLQHLSTAKQKTHTHYTHTTASTTYQQAFGRQSDIYPPDDTKMTLSSCPAPLNLGNTTEENYLQ